MELLNFDVDILEIEEPSHNIDFSFIKQKEGYSSTAYVPKDKAGKVVGKSGVTIGSGLDLGHKTESGLKSLGVSDDVIIKVKPFLGKKGEDAKQALESNTLSLDESTIADVQDKVYDDLFSTYTKYYNKETKKKFSDLDPKVQTAIGSVISQYGPNLKKRTPKFNKAIIDNDIPAMKKELESFGDKYPTRRKSEASLLEGLSFLNLFSVKDAFAEGSNNRLLNFDLEDDGSFADQLSQAEEEVNERVSQELQKSADAVIASGGVEKKTEEVTNKFVDVLAGGLSIDEADEFKRKSIEEIPNPEDFAKASKFIGKRLGKQFLKNITTMEKFIAAPSIEMIRALKTPDDDEEDIPEKDAEEGKEEALKILGFAFKPFGRAVESFRSAIGSAIDGDSLADAAQDAVSGFLKPEEVEPLTERIPGLSMEDIQEGGMARLVTRAFVEAIETVVIADMTFGGPLRRDILQAPAKIRTKVQERMLDRAFNKVPQILKDQGFAENEIIKMSESEAFRDFLLHKVKDPKTGKTLAETVTDKSTLRGIFEDIASAGKAGQAKINFNIGDSAKFGEKVGKIIRIQGPKAFLNIAGKEVEANLAELKAADIEKKPFVVKAPAGKKIIKYPGIPEFTSTDAPGGAQEYGRENKDNPEVIQRLKDALADTAKRREVLDANPESGVPGTVTSQALRDVGEESQMYREALEAAEVPREEIEGLKKEATDVRLEEESKQYKTVEGKVGEKIYKAIGNQEYYSVDKGFSWKPVLKESIEVTGKRLGKGKGKHGTFYNIMPDLETRYPEYKGRLEEKQLKIDNVLKVEKVTDETYPVKDLFYRWFTSENLQNEMNNTGLESDEAMDKMVAEEAVRRGYDAIQFGDQEIVDLRDTVPSVPEKRDGDLVDVINDERNRLISKGITKGKEFDAITDVWKSLKQGMDVSNDKIQDAILGVEDALEAAGIPREEIEGLKAAKPAQKIEESLIEEAKKFDKVEEFVKEKQTLFPPSVKELSKLDLKGKELELQEEHEIEIFADKHATWGMTDKEVEENLNPLKFKAFENLEAAKEEIKKTGKITPSANEFSMFFSDPFPVLEGEAATKEIARLEKILRNYQKITDEHQEIKDKFFYFGKWNKAPITKEMKKLISIWDQAHKPIPSVQEEPTEFSEFTEFISEPKPPTQEEVSYHKDWDELEADITPAELSAEEQAALKKLNAEAKKELKGFRDTINLAVKGKLKFQGGEEEELIPSYLFAKPDNPDAMTLDAIAGSEDVGNSLEILGYEANDEGLRNYIYETYGQNPGYLRKSLRKLRGAKRDSETSKIAKKIEKQRKARLRQAYQRFLEVQRQLKPRNVAHKSVIQKIVGIYRPEKKTISEKSALKRLMQRLQAVSRKAALEGKREGISQEKIRVKDVLAGIERKSEKSALKRLMQRLQAVSRKAALEGKREGISQEKIRVKDVLAGIERKGELRLLKEDIKTRDLLTSRAAKKESQLLDRYNRLKRKNELGLLKEDIRRRSELSRLKKYFQDKEQARRDRKILSDEVKKMIKFIRDMPTKNLPLEYKDVIEEIKKSVEFGKVLLSNVLRRTKVRRDLDINEQLAERVSDLEKIRADEMTVDELREVYEIVRQLYHSGLNADKLLKSNQTKKLSELVVLGSKTIRKGSIDDLPPYQRHLEKGWKDTPASFKRQYISEHRRPEALFEQFDGWREGVNYNVAFKVLVKGELTVKENIAVTNQKIEQIFKKIKISKLLHAKKNVEGYEVGLTRDNLMFIYANSLHPQNEVHLLNSGITEDMIDTASLALTTDEKDVVHAIMDFFVKEIWPRLDKVYSNLTGTHLGKIPENYFPIMNLENIGDIEAIEMNIKLLEDYIRTGNPGFLKGREKISKKAYKRYSFFENVYKYIHQSEYYIGMAEALRDSSKYLRNPIIRESINISYGEEYTKMLDKWLDDVKRGRDKPSEGLLDSISLALRGNFVVSVLGGNLSTVLKQPASFVQGMGYIGKGWAMRGLAKFMANPRKSLHFAKEKSILMRNRKFSHERELQEIMKGRGLAKRFGQSDLRDIKQMIREGSMVPIVVADEVTTTCIWIGAYDKQMARNPLDEQAAIDYADKAIRRTQPQSGLIHLPALFRAGPFKKLVTTFKNQPSQNWNLLYDTSVKYATTTKTPHSFAEFMAKNYYYLLFGGLLFGYLEKKRFQKNPKEVALDLVSQVTSGLFFLGDIVQKIKYPWGSANLLDSIRGEIAEIITARKVGAKAKHLGRAIAQTRGFPGYTAIERFILRESIKTKLLGGEKAKKSKKIQF